MSKICPRCMREQKDQSLLACPKCGDLYVEASDLVKHFTKDELKTIAGFLLKDWRVYVVAGFFVLIGIGILYWQVHEQLKTQIEKFQTTASNQVVVAYSTATNQLAAKFQVFAADASNQIASAYSSVTNQIAAEFQLPKVKETIETAAKGKAEDILRSEVRPVVESFRSDVSNQLSAIVRHADLFDIASRADANDFHAYLQLRDLASRNDDTGKYANQHVTAIERKLEEDRGALTFEVFRESTNDISFDGPFTSGEMALNLRLARTFNPTLREGMVNVAGGLHEILLLPSFVALFTNEINLRAANRETMFISELTKQTVQPKDLEDFKKWWAEHEHSYTNWPFADFDKMQESLLKGDLPTMLHACDEALKVDPKADKIRCAAVVFNLELGLTNKAMALTNGFAIQAGRWKKYALAKFEIESGQITNGTTHLAELSTSFPLMPITENDKSNFWRKVDWKLYDQIVKKINQNKRKSKSMPTFDPTKPATNSLVATSELRDQLNTLYAVLACNNALK